MEEEQKPDWSSGPPIMNPKEESDGGDADGDDDSIGAASKSPSDTGNETAGDDSTDQIKEVKDMAKSETRSIQSLRIVVVVLILGAGAVVSTGAYLYLNQQFIQDSKHSFALFLNTIEDVSKIHFKSFFESSRAMSRSLTAEVLAQNWTFPCVTFPMYEVYAKEARDRAGIEVMSYAPIIWGRDLDQFNSYTLENTGWVEQGRELAAKIDPLLIDRNYSSAEIPPFITRFNFATGQIEIVNGTGPFAPLWQTSPPPLNPFLLKADFAAFPVYVDNYKAIDTIRDAILSLAYTGWDTVGAFIGYDLHQELHDIRHHKPSVQVNISQPHVSIIQPVFSSFDETAEIVGYLMGIMAFDAYLVDLLPDGVNGVYLILESTCGDQHTYLLHGNDVQYMGEGDLTDPAYHSWGRTIDFGENYQDYDLVKATPGHCIYNYRVFASVTFQEQFNSNLSIIFAVAVALIFVVMAVVFFVYDMFVQRRNEKVVGAAARSNAIVSSLFPQNVRDRLFAEKEEEQRKKNGYRPNKSNLKSFLAGDAIGDINQGGGGDDDDEVVLRSKPIADLFTDTTVMFADICGFTAWSSVREPTQVFTLLETVYRAFDQIAKRRRVFKVETVGDCYVAVCGLPDPRKDHAVVMARFARDCILALDHLTKKLEVKLGPDTGDLSIRVGMHSGPVTAGVLRGERARFQLFGDTMNTASRLESSGMRRRIQISHETAALLRDAGKGSWLSKRDDAVHAKGKGVLTTYWVNVKSDKSESVASWSESSVSRVEGIAHTGRNNMDLAMGLTSDKMARLIDWNVEVLLSLLKQVAARRTATLFNQKNLEDIVMIPAAVEESVMQSSTGTTVLDEVQEIITLPKFDRKVAERQQDPETIDLGPEVTSQLRDFISSIAAMYRINPFHNFEHASHVTMSVVKLLSRIVAPSDLDLENNRKDKLASTLHDHTYGITSDPLTQFACVLSALIHDVDHPGVPNAQLVKERTDLAMFYKGKSIAEQNSVDLTWRLLLDPKYNMLRSTIYSTEQDMKRFRQLVVNSVMATDIMDKDLKMLRNNRWDRAFYDEKTIGSVQDSVNRKATIVIEHLIQASDVSHTMQHWHIYRKWNERFFQECYRAYRDGRAEKDPSEGWYEGELGFFDYYIIPLAKKLKDCGVFGVSSDEYLNYAVRNRQEWEARGQDIVQEMLEKVQGLSSQWGQDEAEQETMAKERLTTVFESVLI